MLDYHRALLQYQYRSSSIDWLFIVIIIQYYSTQYNRKSTSDFFRSSTKVELELYGVRA